MEIAVIGNSDFVLGFRLAGIRKTYDATSQDIEEKIKSVMGDSSVAILVMHDNDIQKISSQIRQTLEDSVEPTVLVIGGKGESTNLREKIKQSVGVDLWK